MNVRIIVATNKDLVAECEVENFRWNLYYRLAVTELQLPKLASRGPEEIDEIDEMFEYFLNHGTQSQTAEAIGWVINILRNKIEKIRHQIGRVYLKINFFPYFYSASHEVDFDSGSFPDTQPDFFYG